jgi:hypothetical protein
MAQVTDPCPHWAVFRMLQRSRGRDCGSQISVLRDGDQFLLYVCHSLRTRDMAGNAHVLSVGVDLVPALRSHTPHADRLVDSIASACLQQHGEAHVPEEAAAAIRGAAKVLNIAWIPDALDKPARIICPRSTHCPRQEHCNGSPASRTREIAEVQQEIIRRSHPRRKAS